MHAPHGSDTDDKEKRKWWERRLEVTEPELGAPEAEPVWLEQKPRSCRVGRGRGRWEGRLWEGLLIPRKALGLAVSQVEATEKSKQ